MIFQAFQYRTESNVAYRYKSKLPQKEYFFGSVPLFGNILNFIYFRRIKTYSGKGILIYSFSFILQS